MSDKNKFPYLLLCEPTHIFEGRQMYRYDFERFRRFVSYLTDYKLFKIKLDSNLGRDLMYDLALKHTLEEYFSVYPGDEKRCLDNLLFL